jgi:hypothetical protein
MAVVTDQGAIIVGISHRRVPCRAQAGMPKSRSVHKSMTCSTAASATASTSASDSSHAICSATSAIRAADSSRAPSCMPSPTPPPHGPAPSVPHRESTAPRQSDRRHRRKNCDFSYFVSNRNSPNCGDTRSRGRCPQRCVSRSCPFFMVMRNRLNADLLLPQVCAAVSSLDDAVSRHADAGTVRRWTRLQFPDQCSTRYRANPTSNV